MVCRRGWGQILTKAQIRLARLGELRPGPALGTEGGPAGGRALPAPLEVAVGRPAREFAMRQDEDRSAAVGPKRLTAQAERALKEAQERRQRAQQAAAPAAKEVGGQQGPEPTRYGDWEKNGIASDF
jgi:hypothetical protein